MILGPPEQITPAVLAFCRTIAPAEPIYVPVRAVEWGRVAYCFDNSETYARKHGGEAVYGWAIWHWPGNWFEAEHHAVWRSPEGQLLDVTPQAGDPQRILFLADPSAPYDPTTFRRNAMAPEEGNELAREYIDLVGKRGEIVDRYWYPGLEIWPLFSQEDASRLAPIDARMEELRQAMKAAR